MRDRDHDDNLVVSILVYKIATNLQHPTDITFYEGSSTTPTTTSYSYTDSCEGLDTSSLVPNVVSVTVGSISEAATVGFNSANMLRWYLNSATMIVEWNNPAILQVFERNRF